MAEAAAEGQRSRLDVLITGFGPFCGVPENPTTELVRSLPGFLQDNPGRNSSAMDLECSLVEVSRDGTTEAVEQLYRGVEEGRAAAGSGRGAPGNKRCLVVHFGVDSGSMCFKCESVAHNMADFRVPDERGLQPRRAPISDLHELDEGVPTNVPVHRVQRALAAQGHEVEVSTNAGRFLCNYIFYISLCKAKAAGDAWCIFVHMPPFACKKREAQLAFARDLLDELYDAIHQVAAAAATAAAPAAPVAAAEAHPNLRGAVALPTADDALIETLCLTGFDHGIAETLVNVAKMDAADGGGQDDYSSVFVNSTAPSLRSVMAVIRMQEGLAFDAIARHGELKLVLAVRTDLDMNKGKIAAQCCHAALEAYRRGMQASPEAVVAWEGCGEPTICVKAPKGQDQLNALEAVARACDVPACRVVDAGRTQVASGTTTVLAVGPAPAGIVDLVTGRLRLL
mmetsp:Transcript_32958/g.104319  ORF Transcript_32958/g.104319 Transcript_32958/m.104319 type:complete len:454 (-) Transcript_32958:505-1866(-)